MAIFQAPDIQGANTGHIRPINAPADTVGAEAISKLAPLAVEGVKQYAISKFEGEITEAKEEYLAGEELLTTEEAGALKDFENKISVYKAGAQQGNRQKEFKTRAEALLKEHSASFPGLADEYRRAASGILGFDATGNSLKEKFAEENDAAADHKAMLKKYEGYAEQFGMTADSIYEPGGADRLQDRLAIRQHIKDVELLAQLRASNKELENNKPISHILFEKVQGEADESTDAATGIVRNMVMDALGVAPKDLHEMDYQSLAALDPRKKQEIINTLKDARARTSNDRAKFRPHFKTSEEWKDYESRVLAPYDLAIEAMSSEEAHKRWTNQNKLMGAAYLNGIQGTETHKLALAFQSMGVDMSNFFETRVAVEIKDQVVKKLAHGLTGDRKAGFTSTTEAPDNAPELPKALDAAGMDLLSNIKNAGELTPVLKKQVENFADMLLQADEKGYNIDSVDALVRTLGDEEQAENLKVVMKDNPFLADELKSALFQHTNKTITAVGQRFKGSDRKLSIDGNNVPQFDLVYKDGQFSVKYNEQYAVDRWNKIYNSKGKPLALGETDEQGRGPKLPQRSTSEIKKLNDIWAGSLNNSVKMAQNLFGDEPDVTAANFLRGTEYEKYLPVDEEGSDSNTPNPTPEKAPVRSPAITPYSTTGVVPEAAKTLDKGKYTLKSGQTVIVNEDGTFEVLK